MTVSCEDEKDAKIQELEKHVEKLEKRVEKLEKRIEQLILLLQKNGITDKDIQETERIKQTIKKHLQSKIKFKKN